MILQTWGLTLDTLQRDNLWRDRGCSEDIDTPEWMDESFLVHVIDGDMAHVTDHCGHEQTVAVKLLHKLCKRESDHDDTVLVSREDGHRALIIRRHRRGGGAWLRNPGKWTWLWCGCVPLATYDVVTETGKAVA